MRPRSCVSRPGVLLIAIVSPALLGSQFKCAFVSNPTLATARIVQIDPTMPRVGEVVRVTGSGDGTSPLQFEWTFGDDAQAIGMQAAHAYVAPGNYRITLTVRDATGSIASDSSDVVVSSRSSSAILGLLLSSPAIAGEPVFFETLPLGEDVSALSYVWTFSNGQYANGRRIAASFPLAGPYHASVTATNDFGAIAFAHISFYVISAPN